MPAQGSHAHGIDPESASFHFAQFDVHGKGDFSRFGSMLPSPKHTFAIMSHLFLGGISMDYHLRLSLWSWYYSIEV